MSEKNMSIVFSATIDRLTEFNSSFDKGVLRVCYVGANRNNSFISEETFEACMPSIYNCPIVCNYDRETGEIGSHDMEIVKGEDGRLSLVNITDPVGVVPESANYWFEDFEEEDGTIHKYLYIEVLLWKRQEAYQKIKEDGITDESMEISIKEGHMENGIYVIERFEFTAFCLLGTAKPCYESASLMVFSQEDFKAKLGEMMREFKETVKTAQSPDGVGIHPQSYSEGGEKALDEKKELMTQYNLTEEMLGFSLDEFSLEELQAKFEEMKAKSKVDEDDTGEDPAQDNGDAGDDNAQAEVQSEPQAEPEGGEGAENFALAEQFLNELIDALHTERYDDPYWSDTTRYCYYDHDPDAKEVYAYDCMDWKLYGFIYSMNGDKVIVDFDSKKRMKTAIVPFDEGEQTAAFAAVYTSMSQKFEQSNKEWSEKYQSAQDELEELRQFKANIDKAENEAKVAGLLEQFADLNGVEAFEKLRGEMEKYSADELEEKCFAIRGRMQSTGKFSLNEQKTPKLPVEHNEPKSEPYGGVFAEYGIGE